MEDDEKKERRTIREYKRKYFLEALVDGRMYSLKALCTNIVKGDLGRRQEKQSFFRDEPKKT
jgi:hypothetical protein